MFDCRIFGCKDRYSADINKTTQEAIDFIKDQAKDSNLSEAEIDHACLDAILYQTRKRNYTDPEVILIEEIKRLNKELDER